MPVGGGGERGKLRNSGASESCSVVFTLAKVPMRSQRMLHFPLVALEPVGVAGLMNDLVAETLKARRKSFIRHPNQQQTKPLGLEDAAYSANTHPGYRGSIGQ